MKRIIFAALVGVAWAAENRAADEPVKTAVADERVEFSHDLHVATAELECATCHDASAPGKPTLNTDACGDCHDGGPPAWKLSSKSRRLAVAFPHQRHSAKLKCTECHEATIADKFPAGTPILTNEKCSSCHAAKAVAVQDSACRKCHGINQRRIAPTSHDKTWRSRHGADAKWQTFATHGMQCTQCHVSATCKACHNAQSPTNHTGLWRERTHGMAASWDRDRCETCHETGTCIRCHTTTPPVSHTGAWLSTHSLAAGMVGNENCGVCHRTTFCVSCHEG